MESKEENPATAVTVQPQQQTLTVQQSFVGHIVLSSTVIFCCNFCFGIAAFVLAS